MNTIIDQQANLGLGLLGLALLASVELAKAARWAVLFGPRRPAYPRFLRALVVGQITNALAPLRAGDVVRVSVLAVQGEPLALTAVSVAGVKAIDAVTLAAVAIALVGVAVLPLVSWSLAAGVAIGCGAAAVAWRAKSVRGWIEVHARKWQPWLASVVNAADALKDPRTMAVILGTSAIVWGAGLLANGALLAAAGVSPNLELAARMLVAGYLVGLAPAPPARVGVFEAGIAVALTSAGVPLAQAILVGVALHVCQLAELGLLLAASFLVPRWSLRRA
jgi:uncharacterized membrane protein YbhN (UPF0104 family)